MEQTLLPENVALRSSQEWRTHAVLLGLLVLLNVAVKITLWVQPPQTFPDSLGYIAPAMRLLDGLGYGSQENGFRTPTYPLFIAAILLPFNHADLSSCREARVPACLGEAQQEPGAQANLRAIVAVQILLGALTILLVYWFAWKISHHAWVAALCAFTYPIDLSTGYWEISVLTDTLTTFLLMLAVCLTLLAAEARQHRGALHAALGVVLGALALCHSVYLLYAVVPAAFLWLRQRQIASQIGSDDSKYNHINNDELSLRAPQGRSNLQHGFPNLTLEIASRRPLAMTSLRTFLVALCRHQNQLSSNDFSRYRIHLALVLVIPAVLVLAWSARNYRVDGYFTPSTISGYNLTQMVGPFMEEAPPSYRDLADIYLDYRAERIAVRGSHSGTIFFAYRDMLAARGTTWAGLSQILTAMSLQMIGRHPQDYARVFWQSFVQFWKFGLGRQNYQLPVSFDWIKWFLDTRVHDAWMVLFFISPLALAFIQLTRRSETFSGVWIWFAMATVLYAALFSSAFNFGDNERYRTHVARLQYSAVMATAWLLIQAVTARLETVKKDRRIV